MKSAVVLFNSRLKSITTHGRIFFVLPLVAIVLLASGCHSVRCRGLFGPDVVIPEKPTAAEQARLAEDQYQDARSIADIETSNEELMKALVAFRTVEKRFPDNRVYTPAAALLQGDIYFQMEKFSCAAHEYRRTIRNYSDIPDVHANALFGLGQSLEERGKIRESKEYYSQVIDLYSDSEVNSIQVVVRLARTKYNEI